MCRPFPVTLQLTYTLKGRGSVFSGDVAMQESTLAGARIAPGTTASFSVGQGAPRYAAKGEVSDLDLQQVGQGFNITALAADRYMSRVNATFDVDGQRRRVAIPAGAGCQRARWSIQKCSAQRFRASTLRRISAAAT